MPLYFRAVNGCAAEKAGRSDADRKSFCITAFRRPTGEIARNYVLPNNGVDGLNAEYPLLALRNAQRYLEQFDRCEQLANYAIGFWRFVLRFRLPIDIRLLLPDAKLATGRTCPVISVINADQHMEPVPRSSTYEKEGEQNRGDGTMANQ